MKEKKKKKKYFYIHPRNWREKFKRVKVVCSFIIPMVDLKLRYCKRKVVC